jgi:hypothetical protein
VPTIPNVIGLSVEEFVFDNTTNPVAATLTYPAADVDPGKARRAAGADRSQIYLRDPDEDLDLPTGRFRCGRHVRVRLHREGRETGGPRLCRAARHCLVPPPREGRRASSFRNGCSSRRTLSGSPTERRRRCEFCEPSDRSPVVAGGTLRWRAEGHAARAAAARKAVDYSIATICRLRGSNPVLQFPRDSRERREEYRHGV